MADNAPNGVGTRWRSQDVYEQEGPRIVWIGASAGGIMAELIGGRIRDITAVPKDPTMNYVVLLDQRLEFILYVYDNSTSWFTETQRAIQAEEPPYEEYRDADDMDGDPPIS